MWLYSQLGGSAYALVGLAVLGLVDVWATPARLIRRWSKTIWLTIEVIPIAGTLAWLFLGRPPLGSGGRVSGGRAAGGRAAGGRAPGRGKTDSTRRRRGRTNLTVVDGGRGVPPNALVQREQLNAEIERSKDLNRRLEEWEAQHRKGPRPEAAPQHAAPPPDSPTTPTTPTPTAPDASDEAFSDDELQATLEQWRSELGDH